MAKEGTRFVVIRIKETTRARLKIRAIRARKKLHEIVEELSHGTA